MAGNDVLVVTMLGPPRVQWQGEALLVPRRQVRALLYRLSTRLEPVPRDVLAALFWPNLPSEIAHTNLSRLLHFLRRALPDPSLLVREEVRVYLDPSRTWSDTHLLAETLRKPHASLTELRRVATLYQGAFLEGFTLSRAPEFDRWLTNERHKWERAYLQLLSLLVEREEREGNYEEAIRWAQRYVSIDELAEAMHRRLILLYATIGDREAALRQFEQCVIVLERELGVDPLPETRAAYDLARGHRVPTRVVTPTWHYTTPVDAPFVGREAALEVLHQAYMRARAGHMSIVLVEGESGIGKTRLLKEFVASLSSRALVLTLTGTEAARDVPYAVLADALQKAFATLDVGTLHLAPSLLVPLTSLIPTLQPLRPSTAGESIQRGEPIRLPQALNALFDALVQRYAPLVLCVDDVHELDESTREWLHTWLAHAVSRPVLLVATYRTGDPRAEKLAHSLLPRHHQGETITLKGLEQAEVRTLAEAVLGIHVPDDVAEDLHQFTGGNPLFLLETLRGLQEAGEGEDNHVDLRAWQASELPYNVRDAVHRRLRRLSPLSYHVLEAAAVLGDRILPDALQETAGYSEEETAIATEDLVARGLLAEENGMYRFVHQVVKEVVYRALSYGRRRLLHRRAARALERLSPQHLARIAFHFQQGELWDEAVHYWLRAGDQARLLHAPAEAIRHYERALALQRERGNDEGAADTLMRLGLAHHMAFSFSEASQAYEEGFTLLQRVWSSSPRLPPAHRPLRVDWPDLPTLDVTQARNANSNGVIEHLFRGLAEWSPDMNVLPDLARGWEVLAEGHQYLFYLREDAVWSDGYPVTAQDFVVAWQRVLHPESRSPFVRLLFPVRRAAAYHHGEETQPTRVGVRALDDLTLLVELEHPCTFFPHLMAHPVTRPIPARVWQQEGERWWHPGHLVTNGPFHLRAWEWGKQVILTRSDTYRGRWPGNVEEVVLHLGIGKVRKEAKWRLYEQDELDVFTLRWGLPPSLMEHIRRRHGQELLSVPNYFVRFLCFNVRAAPFHHRDVRRAFALATNRHIVAALMGGDMTPAYGGLIPPGMPGHTPDGGIPFDPISAQAALAAAGYPSGRGFPEVTLLVFEALRPLGEYLQQAWQRILKVPIRLEVVPWSAYLNRVDEDPPHLFVLGWVADYPSPDCFLRVSRIDKRTGWHHPSYAKLIERALNARDQDERIALYRQADRILLDDLPILPLIYSRWALLIKPRIRTFPVSPLKWWFWKDVVMEVSE